MSKNVSTINGSPRAYTATMDYLRGVDLTSDPINVMQGRAFNAPNMIRDVPGKVRKRMGYSLYRKYSGHINGIFQYGDEVLVHAGTDFYRDGEEPELIRSGLADHRSNAYLIYYDEGEQDVLVILDGTTMWAYMGNLLFAASEKATIPQVTVGRAPNGEGGDSLSMVNMLTDLYTDSFLGTAADTEYQMSYFPLVNTEAISVERIDENGDWIDITNLISNVDAETGVITFSEAPGEPPVSGEDNIHITASSVHEGYKDRVNHCQFGILYGANGAWDRLFIAGNPDIPDSDWYCDSADPFMWGDWNYGEIGKAASPITGYTIVNGYLATHKECDDTERNCYLRKGELTYKEAQEGEEEDIDLQTVKFPVTDIIQGTGAIAPASFAYMTEPLYLAKDGIYATTPYEYNSLLYAQKRSRLIDGELLKEFNLKDAVAINYNDFYMLAVGDRVYILDTLQKDTTGITRGSNYQYEAYHWTNVPVRCWFVKDDRLYFGTDGGDIMLFANDKTAEASYTDNGTAIDARWEFYHTGKNIHLNKDLRRVTVNCRGTNNSDIELYYKKSEDDIYQRCLYHATVSRIFKYSTLRYSDMYYGGSDRPRTIGRKVKVRKYDACELSLRNSGDRQGMFIYAIVLEFTEGLHYVI